jgi:hypothetical protein
MPVYVYENGKRKSFTSRVCRRRFIYKHTAVCHQTVIINNDRIASVYTTCFAQIGLCLNMAYGCGYVENSVRKISHPTYITFMCMFMTHSSASN